ncbi:MAG: hypothetical protein GX434_14440 [Peptococcaceae bacterium]|nr:hypothetical protein [Peptococcaceae bacterium]
MRVWHSAQNATSRSQDMAINMENTTNAVAEVANVAQNQALLSESLNNLSERFKL